MSSFEKKFEDDIAARELPGVVLIAYNIKGDFQYQKAFGSKSLAHPAVPLPVDATFWLASLTKLLTSIAALQLVERGLINLDDDVSSILVEFEDKEILTGFDENEKPILKKAENKVTLRTLLTHTSGSEYDALNPLLTRWRISRGESITLDSTGLPFMSRIGTPLTFEPGTSWGYGFGHDWVGVLVARVAKTDLQTYMQTYIWEPLGIKDMTFHLEQRPDIRERLLATSIRDGGITSMGTALDPDGKLMYSSDKYPFVDPTEAEWGGVGLYGNALDYIKILRSLLVKDGILLKSQMVDLLFQPQLGEAEQTALMACLKVPALNAAMGALPIGTKVNYSLGGLLVSEDLETGRRKGSMTWAGVSGPIWWIDPEAGICGLSATQILPFGDEKLNDMHWTWEKEMYRKTQDFEVGSNTG